MKIFGRRYIVDHIKYMAEKEDEAYAYKIYVADALRAMTGNQENPRYTEWIDNLRKPKDDRSPEQIKNEIKNSYNRMVRMNGSS